MRADRLVAALLVLQRRGRITAADLARELEVSVATARRDLEALSAAGIPVYPQAGRNGGWQLLGGARTDLSGLTADETRALFVLAGPATTAAPAVKSALRKLVRALPEPMRDSADAAAAAVVIDSRRWGDTVRRPRPTGLELLQAAVIDRAAVELDYRDRGGVTSARLVHPLGLADKSGAWYLMAGTTAGLRTFRVDRVVAARLTGEHFDRPADFDLQNAWSHAVEEIERYRASVTATVRVPAHLTWYFLGQWGRHARVTDKQEDVNLVVVGDRSTIAIARQLAGWADAIEVVEPTAVRDELVRIGEALVRRNLDAPVPR
ncbi:MAG TPA: WYL domain-containing protein [Ilumatobacter sp.]|nr:WYL domain-containing protein [Ilumatobacter sp.]